MDSGGVMLKVGLVAQVVGWNHGAIMVMLGRYYSTGVNTDGSKY